MGKAPEQHARRQISPILGAEFGEKLLVKRKIETNYLDKTLPRWDYGVFLGAGQSSGELFIMGEDGLKVGRSVRQIPVE